MITIEVVPDINAIPEITQMLNGDCKIYLNDSDNKLYCYTKYYTGEVVKTVFNANINVDDLLDSLEFDG